VIAADRQRPWRNCPFGARPAGYELFVRNTLSRDERESSSKILLASRS
jgi:hypothetical protein